MQTYRTVETDADSELIISKSRFLGVCHPVSSEEEAVAYIESVRKQYWDAKHHCYAYCIGDKRQITRSSDDGEPSGTAGAPILDTIIKKGLTNTICIVTRYFGGILLGTGGLVRAYSQACSQAVSKAGIVEMVPGSVLDMRLSYQDWHKISQLLEDEGYKTDQAEYLDNVHVVFRSLEENVMDITEKIYNRTDGRVTANVTKDCIIPKPVLE